MIGRTVHPNSHRTPRTRRGLRRVPPSVALVASALTALVAALIPALVAPGPAGAAGVQPHVYAQSGVLHYGDAPWEGSPKGSTLNSVVVGLASSHDGKGYWVVAADGGVFSYGDAHFHGSAGALHLYAPIVGMAATPDGNGYWLVAADGGVFSYGDAHFHGSMGGKPLDQPVVGMASSPDGNGYWLVAADGGIFSFGDAHFHGSMGGQPLDAPVTGMAASPNGGYWMVAADGGIFSFDAPFHGSLGGLPIPAGITSMAATSNGGGYWLVGWDGSVYTRGNAPPEGSDGGHIPPDPVSAIAATPDNKGYWLLTPDDINYSFSDPPPYGVPYGSGVAAAAESQVQGDPNIGQGQFCNPYGPCEPWCALFASWAWRVNGVPIPVYPFTGSFYYWGASHSRVLPGSALAAPGDAILYGTGPQNADTSPHMGIVAEVWPDGAVVTIEGDAGPAPNGDFSVILNGPFLPTHSMEYNGFPVYAFVQP
jgi:hypothetical protein